jgi:alkylation response protein AidB-like acyl-CoA dehydrogenase
MNNDAFLGRSSQQTSGMRFLARERECLERYLPGLDKALQAHSLTELERPGSPGIRAFKEHGGVKLLIPTAYAGLGASAPDIVHIQRAIATRSPSLAVATMMHHFSVATLVEMAAVQQGLNWLLVEAIASQNLLVASAFAEGKPSTGILTPCARLKRAGGALTVTGSKKPCSLSKSMDLLTISMSDSDEDGSNPRLAVGLIRADAPGMERRPFWQSNVLAGAESDELLLKDVPITEEALFYSGAADVLDAVQLRGFLWFQLIVSSSYLGIASALMERALLAQRGNPEERCVLAIELEGAMSALEGLAQQIASKDADEEVLARSLYVRFMVQRSIERASMLAAELLGGISFISSPDIAYLLAASRAIAFHPPSRLSISKTLDEYLSSGKRLGLQ